MCLSINFNLKLAVFNFKKIVNFIARFFFLVWHTNQKRPFFLCIFSPLCYHFSFSLFVCLLKPWAYTGYSCRPLVNNSRLRWRRFLDFSLVFASLVHTNRRQKAVLQFLSFSNYPLMHCLFTYDVVYFLHLYLARIGLWLSNAENWPKLSGI